jgi:hypothetical protein
MPARTPTAPTVVAPQPSEGSATGTLLTALWQGRSPAAAADAVWVPLISAVLIVAAGAMSLATGRPWLFAALGPTAVMIAASPGHPTTKFHSIVLSHAAAFLCAWLAVLLLGVGREPVLLGREIAVGRVWASALAVGVTALVMPSLRAYHPPAAATALLVTLGAYRITWKNSLSLLAGVVVVAVLGEWFQRVRLAERRAAKAQR